MTGRTPLQTGLAAIAVVLFVLCQFTCTMLRPYSSEYGTQAKLESRHHPFHCVIKHASHNQTQIRVQREYKVIPAVEPCAIATLSSFAPVQAFEISTQVFCKTTADRLWLLYCCLLL